MWLYQYGSHDVGVAIRNSSAYIKVGRTVHVKINSNQYKPTYQPDVKSIEVIPQRMGKAVKFKVAKPHSQEKDRFFEYLISVDVPSGLHRVGNVAGQSHSFLFIGSFQFPVGASFELPPNAVV